MVIVVGAGPAGLAVAYELQRRGLPYQVLERATIGYAWQQHYDRLHLHTLKQLSALPGLPMPQSYPAFPSAAQFQRYLQEYARHFQLAIRCGVEVHAARWQADGWQIQTSAGDLTAELLVVATGIWSTPYQPLLAGRAQFGGTIMHSSQYRNPAPFAGQRVLVVGVGNSGSEIAVDLAEQGVTTGIAIRGGATFVPYPRAATPLRLWAGLLRYLPRPAGERLLRRFRRDFSAIGIPAPAKPLLDAYPVVGYRLPDAIAAGRIRRYAGLAGLIQGGAQFDDGQSAPFDSVILATGYRPTVQFVAGAVALDPAGRPQVDQHWRSLRQPKLVCVGFHYPATEGWLQAIGRVAREAVAGMTSGL